MDSPIGSAEVVIESGVYPSLKITPTPLCVNVGGPGNSERVHVVAMFENVGRIETVLTTRARHDTVI